MNFRDFRGVTLQPNERLDDLQRNGYVLIQDAKQFRFGVDAVLLTDFVRLKKGEWVLDLGTGTGVIPILLCGKSADTRIDGLEIQHAFADMARRSVVLNALEYRVAIVEGDIKNAARLFPPAAFDVITANPPYIQQGGGVYRTDDPKAVSKHEILCTLEDVVSAAARLLKPGGRFYMVHRPQRLADIFCLSRRYGLEPKTMRMVQAYADRNPVLVLTEAVKGGGVMLKTLAALVLYESKGIYSKEVSEIYGSDRNGKPLPG